MAEPSPLLRAVRRAARREVMGRFADAWFAGAIVAVIVFLLGIILLTTGLILELSVVTIALSAVLAMGLRWMFGTSSHPVAVASRLDQANQTRDLLATALSMPPADPWSRTLRAQAEHASDRLVYPSPLGRHTLRTHLATTAALAAVIMVALILAPQTHPFASDAEAFAAATDRAGSPLTRVGSTIRKPGEGASDSTFADSTDTPSTGASTGSDPRQSNGAADATGDGRSDAGAGSVLRPTQSPGNPSTGSANTTARGSGTEGTGMPGSTGAGGTSDSTTPTSATPWQSDAWSASRDAALQAVSSQDVPQDRRELVRAYFDR